jgi:hypothetical protein
MCGMMRTEKYQEHVSLDPAFRRYPVDVSNLVCSTERVEGDQMPQRATSEVKVRTGKEQSAAPAFETTNHRFSHMRLSCWRGPIQVL